MRSLPKRIKNRISIGTARLQHEFFKKTISERALRSRLGSELGRSLPPGADFWPALYERFVESCPADIRSHDRALFRTRERTIAEALAGRIRVLGRDLEIPPGYDWNTDLFFNVRWERMYYKAMADSRPGSDLVLLWMPNRMLHLLDLSFAFAVTKDERYATEWTRQAVSWCRANPPGVGMNWRSPLEIGIRLFVFGVGLRELAGSSSLDPESIGTLIRSVVLQGEHLAANFSYWEGNANNHLIGEAATLYAHASMWNLFERSEEWRALSRDVFEREIERQVLSDGVSFERAPNYHVQVLDFSLLYLLFRGAMNEPAESGAAGQAEKMARAYLAMLSPRGRLPRFGDDTARELLIMENGDSLEGRVFDDPIRFESAVKAEFLPALREAPGVRAILAASEPLEINRVMPASGFATMRSSRTHLAYSAGMASGEALHDGHFHSDLGTFELEIDGEMAFIDSGTWLYTYDARRREHFKGTRAHNALLVDGRELMESAATFKWKSVKKARRLQHAAERGAGYVWSQHAVDGDGGGRFTHTRALIQTGAGAWLIVDHLDPDGDRGGGSPEAPRHRAEVLFHTPCERMETLPSGLGVAFAANARGRNADGGEAAPRSWRFDGASSAGYRMRAIADRDDPLSWYAPRYGELRFGGTIAGAIAFSGAVSICHVLSALERPLPVIECGAGAVTVRLADPREEWRCEFKPVRIMRDGVVMAALPAAGNTRNHETRSHE